MDQEFSIHCAHCKSKKIHLLGNQIPDSITYKFDKAQLFIGCEDCPGITCVSMYNANVDPEKPDPILQLLPIDKNLIKYDYVNRQYTVNQIIFS